MERTHSVPRGSEPVQASSGHLEPPPTESCSPMVEEWLVEENRQLRKAGCKLAEAALRVAREYDGIHRLMLAVSEWADAIANEGGRGKTNKDADRRCPAGRFEAVKVWNPTPSGATPTKNQQRK